MHGNVALREKRVNHETVGAPDDILIAQIQHHQFAVHRGTAFDLLRGLGLLLKIELRPFLHVRQLQDILNEIGAAMLDKLHHQVVVADPELAEAPQAGARVHDIVEQGPALRRKDVLPGIPGGVGLVHGAHHFLRDAHKALPPAEIFVDDPGRRGSFGINDVILGPRAAQAQGFREVVVEDQMSLGIVRQIGGDVVFGDLHLAVLHILGMNEFDAVQYVHFF